MCALFGINDYGNRLTSRQKEIILSVLSQECEIRGKDATGISYLRNGKLQVYKRPLPASMMKYNLPPEIKVIMGHTRMTTQGSEKHNHNNHPFYGKTKNNTFTLCHNGILQNDKELRKSMNLPKTHIETDSYVAVQIIERANSVAFDSLRKMAECVRGSFVFTVLDNRDNLYFVRGDNPLCIYHFTKIGFYLYASTDEILDKAIARLGLNKYEHESIPVQLGDILRIDVRGNIEKSTFQPTEYQMRWHGCGFDDSWEIAHDKNKNGDTTDEYLDMLKQLSGLYGYTPEDIDDLFAEGWTPEEIESMFYDEICEDENCFERVH